MLKANSKYRLTDEIIKMAYGRTLYRIEAVKSFGNVKKGDRGGFVEDLHNLSEDGTSWIYNNAMVYEGACIKDDSIVCDTAIVRDHATVCGVSEVCNNSLVCDSAIICNKSVIYGCKIYGNVIVEYSSLGGVEIGGDAYLDNVDINGPICITGDAQISRNYKFDNEFIKGT